MIPSASAIALTALLVARIATAAPEAAPVSQPAWSLDASIAPTELVVGQAARLTVRWTLAVPPAQCNALAFDIPLLRHPGILAVPEPPDAPENERIGLPVAGQRVIGRMVSAPGDATSITFAYQIVPKHPERIPQSLAALTCAVLRKPASSSKYPSYFDNHFFNPPPQNAPHDNITLNASLPGIEARALPEEGRSRFFSGIVGPCSVSASAKPERVVVGQPVLLTVAIEDLDCPQALNALPPACLAPMAVDFEISRTPLRETEEPSARTFTYVLRPLHDGVKRIPAVAVQRFDPSVQRYSTERSQSLKLDVRPDGVKTRWTPPAKSEPPLVPASGIRQNKRTNTMTSLLLPLLFTLAGQAWLVLLLPPAAWLALRPLARHRRRRREDPAYARAAAAPRVFRKLHRSDPAAAWHRFLADRLGLEAAALTGGSVCRELRRRQAAPDLVREVAGVFHDDDRAIYREGQMSSSTGNASRYATLVRRISRATLPAMVALLVAAFTGTSSASNGESADLLFQKGMEARQEQPDHAHSLFTMAAMEYEKHRQYVNAGNSWWFAGRTGQALANYRAAERLAPTDPGIREAIDTVLARRGAVRVQGARSASTPTHWWGSLLRWHPSLRLGLLLLAYLAAWAVFLFYRIVPARNPPVPALAAAGLLMLTLLLSLADSARRPPNGVVLETTEARLGPGYAYDAAFDRPLPEATEAGVLEKRNGWCRIRLNANSECWIRSENIRTQ